MANCISLCSVRRSGGQQGTSSMQITWLIASGQLKPGDRLPAVCRLAEHLSINLHTVRSAYQKVEMQGLVETRRGRGTHVLSFDLRLVAQAASPLRSHTVGVIVAGWGNSFYHTFLCGVEEVAEEDQTLLILCTTHYDHVAVAWLVERASYLATRPALLPEHEPLIPQPRHIAGTPELGDVRAFVSEFSHVYTPGAIRLLRRLGLEVFDPVPPRDPIAWTVDRAIRLWIWLLRRAFNPASVRGLRPRDLQRRRVWLGRRTLVALYG